MKDIRKVQFLQEIQTGIITDAMILLGLEGWMRDVFPANKEHKMVGNAVTVQLTPVRDRHERAYAFYDIVDMCEEGDIIVIAGQGTDARLMGENMYHAAYYKGLAGIVLDGRARDYGEIAKLSMPHFSKGSAMRPVASELKYTIVNEPIVCAGALVNPGDYVVGDIDGVLVFSPDKADDIIYQCEMILEVENEMEDALKNKVPMKQVMEIAKKKKKLRV